MSQTFMWKHNYDERGTFKIDCTFVFGLKSFSWRVKVLLVYDITRRTLTRLCCIFWIYIQNLNCVHNAWRPQLNFLNVSCWRRECTMKFQHLIVPAFIFTLLVKMYSFRTDSWRSCVTSQGTYFNGSLFCLTSYENPLHTKFQVHHQNTD